ncbi:MAG: hypothetical protein HY765_05885 [Rhodomicrobium sp.]|nr:hypothetical protein [Rhodomicrobium sp.]
MRFIAALLTLAFLLPLPAAAQHRRYRERDYDRQCREVIRAAGDAYHLLRAAKKSAIKRWQEQVINAHGERYINYANARVVDFHCDPARVGGGDTILDLKRCVVAARPCRNENDS